MLSRELLKAIQDNSGSQWNDKVDSRRIHWVYAGNLKQHTITSINMERNPVRTRTHLSLSGGYEGYIKILCQLPWKFHWWHSRFLIHFITSVCIERIRSVDAVELSVLVYACVIWFTVHCSFLSICSGTGSANPQSNVNKLCLRQTLPKYKQYPDKNGSLSR